MIPLIEDDSLGQAVLQHGRAFVEAEQVGVFSLTDGLEVGQIVDHDHGVGHLRLECLRNFCQRHLGEAGKAVPRDPVRDGEGLWPQRCGAAKGRRRLRMLEPDPHPPEQVPGGRIFLGVERLLREIRRHRHVPRAVGEAGGEPQPAGVDLFRQGSQLSQRV